MPIKKALLWVGIWISAALIFNVGILFFLGQKHALEFFGGYIIEQSLSIDNLFLFILIFSSFGITGALQRKILNWGIIGAIVLRFVFIIVGVAAVNAFHWILYIFGIVLIFSGIKMAFEKEGKKDINDSKIIQMFRKTGRMTQSLEGSKFFVKREGKTFVTPLLAILVLIELTDIIFAIDSIPAIFSITTDAFIVFSSNLFAIMGLRSMYFVLHKLHQKFEYVKYGVSLILMFTGVKLGILFFHIEISTEVSLGVIFAILFTSIFFSFTVAKNKEKKRKLEEK
ncbi:MAG: TerC/Alx family metal homeostasis membrane protein [Bacillota bacterium]